MENEIKKEEEGGEAFKKLQHQEELVKKIVPPHKKASRLVTNQDMDRVIEEIKVLYELCFAEVGIYRGAYAMAHPQIDDKDPLQLFVTQDRIIVINPVITRHVNYTKDSPEACMSYSDRATIIVPRWPKIEVDFVTVMVDPNDKDKFCLSSVQKNTLKGMDANVFQHEVDHLAGKYIYQDEEK